MSSASQVPPVIWAQRKDKIFISYMVENTVSPKVEVEPQTLKFDSKTVADKHYKLDFDLFNEIDAEKSIVSIKDRLVDVTLKKKEDDTAFWPRLTKEKQVNHWLKVNFEKWIDEDEAEEADTPNLMDDNYANMFGGMEGLMGGKDFSGMDGLGDDEPLSDSDDEGDKDLPSLEPADEETDAGDKKKSDEK